MKERRVRLEEEKLRQQHDQRKIENLLDRLDKSRTLCRENTRELLRTKKASYAHERKLLDEKAQLIQDMTLIRKQLYSEQHRNETAEKVIETRVNKSQERVMVDLKNQNSKLEEELRQTKARMDEMEGAHTRKIDHFKARLGHVQAK